MEHCERIYPDWLYRSFIEDEPRQLYRLGHRRLSFEAPDFVGYDDCVMSFPTYVRLECMSFCTRSSETHLRKHNKLFRSPVPKKPNEFAGWAVFDVTDVLYGGWTTLWNVLNLIDYLDPNRTFFSHADCKWALDNDE